MSTIESATDWNRKIPCNFYFFSMNMYNLRRLYPYKHNNLTCLVYNEKNFNNDDCDLKLKIVAGVWKNWNENTVNEYWSMNVSAYKIKNH